MPPAEPPLVDVSPPLEPDVPLPASVVEPVEPPEELRPVVAIDPDVATLVPPTLLVGVPPPQLQLQTTKTAAAVTMDLIWAPYLQPISRSNNGAMPSLP